MKKKRLFITLCAALILGIMFAIPASANAADVSTAIESTWKAAATQIKSVVNSVVFPAIDLILAVLFFVKLATAWLDCAPVKAV